MWDLATWKTALSSVSGILVGVLFLVAGIWKVTDPFSASVRLEQVQVPPAISLPLAIVLGIAETYAGVLLFVPRFRRWGAVLTGLLLIAFLIHIAIYYDVLRGEECNCFPWIKRAVGPAFFVGDGVMLLLAFLAGRWARPSESKRSAALVLGAVAVFALVCFGVAAARVSSVTAPAWISVEGRHFPLHQGRVFIYFYDPECTQCDQAARRMAQYRWKNVALIAVPTARPQFAREFMDSTGFKGLISTDVDKLRGSFFFTDPPYAVALENGRQKVAFTRFDQQEPEATLRALGYIH